MLPSVLPRLTTESAVRVSWCLETSLFLRLPSWDGVPSLPLLSLFSVFYIFSYLFSKTMGCFSGCLMSSANIQKLFCADHSGFKCSFDEFVKEKVVSPSYSSDILGPSPMCLFKLWFPQGVYLGVRLLGHMVVFFLVFKGIYIPSSIVAVLIYIPTNSARRFPFLYTLSSIYCL